MELFQRKNSRAWGAGPIETYYGSAFQIRLAVAECLEERDTADLGCQRFTSEQRHTRSVSPGLCENMREIEIVRENNEAVRPCIFAYSRVRRARVTHRRPVSSFVACADQVLSPPDGQVHVDEYPHQLASGNSRPCARAAA